MSITAEGCEEPEDGKAGRERGQRGVPRTDGRHGDGHRHAGGNRAGMIVDADGRERRGGQSGEGHRHGLTAELGRTVWNAVWAATMTTLARSVRNRAGHHHQRGVHRSPPIATATPSPAAMATTGPSGDRPRRRPRSPSPTEAAVVRSTTRRRFAGQEDRRGEGEPRRIGEPAADHQAGGDDRSHAHQSVSAAPR